MHTLALGTYQHYKGGFYEVFGVGNMHHGDRLELVVMYRSLEDKDDYPAGSLWARPLSDFIATVEYNGKKVARFTKII